MKDYEARGFTVLAVENGLATDLPTLTAHVRASGLAYPVLHDGAGANTERYGVRAFPSAFVLNKNGRVVWEGVPLGGGLEAAKRAIVAALDS